MAKNAVTDWDENPNLNTDIGGTNIDEGCAPSGMNNAVRTVMSQLKTFFKSSVFQLRDSTDQTKLLAFDLSGLVSGLTTFKFPSTAGTLALLSDAARGQAYLALSGGNLVLSPYCGNSLWINGANYAVPAAGISLAPAGLVAGTAYYIYAYMNAGVMTLDASTTGYTITSATGMAQKSGDATRALVGLWLATGTNTWSASACGGASWFNPLPKMAAGATGNTTSTSATFVELATGCRLDFVTFPGRQVVFSESGSFAHSTTAQNGQMDIGLDGLTQQLPVALNVRNSAASAAQVSLLSGAVGVFPTVGKHYITPLVSTTSATATWSNAYVSATIQG